MIPDSVRKLPLFSDLGEGEKDTLLAGAKLRELSRGDTLFHYGDPVTHFYVICQGQIQLFRATGDGHEKTLDILKSGQTLCEAEIMDSCRTHRANAMAVEKAVIIEFPVGWLKDAAKKHGAFALNLLSLISQQAHMAEIEAEHQATMSAAQLVAWFLQRLCVLYDFDPKGFELPYSKTLIASRLGMELETFSRTLGKLRDQGIVVTGTQVSITDLTQLGEYVCSICSVADDCATHDVIGKKTHG